jgi:hypothetical protein
MPLGWGTSPGRAESDGERGIKFVALGIGSFADSTQQPDMRI